MFGPVEPLKAAGEIDRSAPWANELVDSLAEVYACPDQRWVRANMITSVDGAATVDDRSGGLSGVADRLVFSLLRSLADVVLVGAGTARAEKYKKVQPDRIWPRLRKGLAPIPPIAVVTRRLNLDLDSPLLEESEPGGAAASAPRTIVLTTEQAPEALRSAVGRTADVVVAGDEDVDLAVALDVLERRGYRRILVEGGPTLLSQLSAARLVDELCVTISPMLEGGYGRRMTTAPHPVDVTGLKLATLLEDDCFLLSRYVRR